MKTLILSALLVVCAQVPFAKADPVTKDVVVSVNEVLVPEKVDQNTDAKIVLSGMFPNSCYRWSRAQVYDASPTFHNIQAHAMVTQTMCLMVLVPYTKEVNLGKLQAGQHTLRFINGDDTYFERTLNVE